MFKCADRPESEKRDGKRDRMAGQRIEKRKEDPKKMLNSGNEPKKLFRINDLTF